ncbi:MAG: hypothetical protein U0174_21005 [Polyangiaceae bacterium]
MTRRSTTAKKDGVILRAFCSDSFGTLGIPASRIVLALVLGASGCAHREPPSYGNGGDADGSVSRTTMPTPAASTAVAPEPTSDPTRDAPADGGNAPSASPSPSGVSTARMSPDADKPQTRDRPKASSADLAARAHALFDAIAKDEPAIAMPFFFPKEAYAQTKAVPNPTRDWQERLVRAFERDIHALHRKVDTSAKYIGLEVPEERGRWVEPEEEYNRIGYYRVFGSRLRYEQNGREHTIELKSLISWRGEWYIVHLSGFK